MIHLILGTKAQYIKMAPVIRRLTDERLPHRLIDTGQHASFSRHLRPELGIREPDVVLRTGADIASVRDAVKWAARILWSSRRRRWVRDVVFGDQSGIVVVHGDTPSTYLGSVLAKRVGLDLAHVEAGLRSWNWANPFPEELIRVAVMRKSDLLFSPDAAASRNIRMMGLDAQVVETGGNTSREELRRAVSGPSAGGNGCVATMHRVENLRRRAVVEGFLQLVEEAARSHPTTIVLHPPTSEALKEFDLLGRLGEMGVTVTPLLAHSDFVTLLANADLVITDGGSIQEECALIGVPTLLWRQATERPDGLGENIVLGHHDVAVGREFLRGFANLRRPSRIDARSPSAAIVDTLREWAVGKAPT